MYEIIVHEDEAITIDFWSRPSAAARQMRPENWVRLVEKWIADGNVIDFDPEPIRKLFQDLRIDGARAIRMLAAGGDVAAAPIDARPEVAREGENQFLDEELRNEEMVFEALRTRKGIRTINFDHDPSVDVFLDMRRQLDGEGKILPGMRGV